MKPNGSLHDIVALVLVGGLGTRLRAVTGAETPKPMAPICGRPFLEILLEQLRRAGLKKVTLLVGHGSEVIEKHFGDGSRFSLEVSYSHEATPLGTGGAIRQAIENSTADGFFVLNGDSLFLTDIGAFLKKRRGPLSMALRESDEVARFGAVEVDPTGRVLAFREKDPTLAHGLINTGLYWIERGALDFFPKGRSSLEMDVFQPHAKLGHLFAQVCTGHFIDIGTPESYQLAQSLIFSWLKEP